MKVHFNREDVVDWKANVVTKSFIEQLEADKLEIVNQWSGGSFTAESSEGTAQLNAKALGHIHAIEQILVGIEDYEDTFDFKEVD